MPLPNDPSYSGGDTVNTQGYLTPVRLPQSSNFFVARIDHDFSSKWHFMTSYRYYGLRQFTSSQIDIGGALPGDTFGQAVSKSTRPAKPSMLVAGLTGTLTPHLTNDFRFSFMRELLGVGYELGSAPASRPRRRGRDGRRIRERADPVQREREQRPRAFLGQLDQRLSRRPHITSRQSPVPVWWYV